LPGIKTKQARELLHIEKYGLARLKQKEYTEAEVLLQEAIEINSMGGAAYCLLAQVLEERVNKNSALWAWENCSLWASPNLPEEDEWINVARKRLKEKKR
jgi:Tfp pilus assembly protein PilF